VRFKDHFSERAPLYALVVDSALCGEHGVDPVTDVEKALAASWGDVDAPRLIRWPLYIRAGTNPKNASGNRGS
jgi:hypothetical protein